MAGIAAVSTLAIALAACGSDTPDAATTTDGTAAAGRTGTLAGAGASSQEKAMNGWLAGFTEANPDVQVSYDPTGSGTGREMFLNAATTFGGSDSKFKEEELAAGAERCFGGEVLELPLYISPIAVAFKIPGLEGQHIDLEAATLAGIFAGTVTAWNDPAILEANPDIADALDAAGAVVPVNRSDDSGTTENFTEYLDAVAADVWTYGPLETWPIEGTQSGNGTSGVVQTVLSGTGTVGYMDASQVSDEMGTVAVKVGEEFVPFSPEAAAAIVDASPAAEDATDLRLTIDLARDTTESGTYPIVLVSYSFACSVYDNEQDAENVKALLSYIAGAEGQDRAADPTVAGSAPISDDLRARALAAIDQISVA
ncbi:MAG: phosphate ABC transporter substrate-binding protein PstS [Georgenia sp.]